MNINFESIVVFLHLKGFNAREIHRDINETFHTNVIGYSTVTKYIRDQKFLRVVDDEEEEEFVPCNFQNQQAILKALNDYPFSSIREISTLTLIPKSSVYRILTEELNYKISNLRWIPHSLNSSQKVERVELCQSLLKTLNKAQHQNFKFFYTGDESWFYLSTDHDIQWIPRGEKPQTREKKTIQSKKHMLTVFWNPEGFLIIEILPEKQKFNGEYFINQILKQIYEKTSWLQRKEKRKIILHYDNARPHTSRKVIQFLNVYHMKRAPHPAYSPDVAPSDFHLFGFIKNELKGRKFDSVESLFEAILEILSKIPKETLKRVFIEWQARLQKVIDSNGDYI